MVVPVFMICAEGTTIDRDSNLVSLFNISERFGGTVTADTKEVRVGFHALAVWRREEEAVGDEDFEFEFLLRYPDGTEKVSAKSVGEVKWRRENAHQRLRLLFTGAIDPLQKGYMHVVARIRPVGEDDWSTQSYPIILDFEQASVSSEA